MNDIYRYDASVDGPSASAHRAGKNSVSRRRRKMLLAAAAAPALSVPAIGFSQSSPPSPSIGDRPAAASPENVSGRERGQNITVVIGGSTGVGISYLPLIVMVHNKLLEKHAALLGIRVRAQWQRFPRAAAMYDALVSGQLDFASGGVSQLLASWDKTRTSVKVKGVGALVSMPIYLVTSNPSVKTIADFTAKDRIAVPEVRTSIQAVTLAMAAEQSFGKGQVSKLDPYTVALGHPQAMKALLDGNTDIDAHFSAAPLMYEEMAAPGIHKVLDSYTVLGGPHTYNAVWTSTQFHDANPKVFAAFVAALREAHGQIQVDPAGAAALWKQTEGVNDMSAAQIERIIRDPEIEWTMTPRKFMTFASFMNEIGLLSTKPDNWQDFFFADVNGLPGD
ncbi:ABC transporter substrate-binding protein [Caballeronia sp. AZ7_KS35]|uniref:ABC transporter substrate-binding protein n=1 Tax=Caballeronia sp. AZ7_KS35 TaxID=2921762 RepID=UPI0020298278|nr:ABC transporter substrate-binding protein [Caballeronia sp. AZ7_KS35]